MARLASQIEQGQAPAYDEMIGQPTWKHSNTLAVKLSPLDDFPPTIH